MVIVALLWLAACASTPGMRGSRSEWSVASPDQKVRVELALDSAGLRYRVRRADDIAVGWSPLGLKYGDADFGADLRVVAASTQPYSDEYRLVHGKTAKVVVRANRLVLDTTDASGAKMRVVFHVQNDGVGFRYELPQQEALPSSAKLTQEYTGFRIAPGARAWLQRQTLPGSYEGGFAAGVAGLDARRKGDTWYVAALNGEEQTRAVSFRPADLGLKGNVHLVLARDGTDRGDNFNIEDRTLDASTPIPVDMRYMGGFLARIRAQ